MKIITKQYAIDSAFIKEPWKKLTYNDIQKSSGKKSRSYIYGAINRLLDEKIITHEHIGKSLLYEPNLASLNARMHLGFLEEYQAWSSKHVPLRIISKLSNLMLGVTPFFIILVTGSYVKKKQTEKSDLDVVVICDDSVNPKRIRAELQLESDLSIPKVHLYVFKRSELLTMLADEKENYGKEFARHHLIFAGGAPYYTILQEAIRHGFRG